MGTQYFVERERGNILNRGPIIQTGIGAPVGPQIESGANNVEFQMVSALLDTGARGYMINPKLAQFLKLPIHGFGKFSSASESDVVAKICIAALSFPPPLHMTYDFVRFLEAPHNMAKHDLIIGRDIIARWHIVFDIDQGRYSISTIDA